MSSPSLSSMVASATAASRQALRALVGLAEALGTPGTVAAALAEAEAALAEAEAALAGLEAAIPAAMAATAATSMPDVGAESLYRALAAITNVHASQLEREVNRIRRRQSGLWVVRTIAVVLMLLCTPLLSFDVVREALGVTQESHLVPCLATVTLVSQVALWGAETSQRHLVTAASHQRQQACRYRRLARDTAVATAAATAATAQAAEAIAAADVPLRLLEVVTCHLKILVAAVTEDLEMAQGFLASAQALGDAVVALGTAMGDKEETQRLAQTLEALRGDK